MILSLLLKRNALILGYALAFWCSLVVLEETLNANGTLTGPLYSLSLPVLFIVIWYSNLPIAKPIHNVWLRFMTLLMTSFALTISFVLVGLLCTIYFKQLVSG